MSESSRLPAHTGSDLLPFDLWKSCSGVGSGLSNGGCLSDVGCLDAPCYMADGHTESMNSMYGWIVVVGIFRRGGE